MTARVGCRFASFFSQHRERQTNFIVAVHFDFVIALPFAHIFLLLFSPSLNHTNHLGVLYFAVSCSIDCVYLFKRPQFITIIFLLSLFVVCQLKGTFGFSVSIYSRVLLLLFTTLSFSGELNDQWWSFLSIFAKLTQWSAVALFASLLWPESIAASQCRLCGASATDHLPTRLTNTANSVCSLQRNR